MNAAHTSDVLRKGLARALDLWRDRAGGANDPLHGVLRLLLADAGGDPVGAQAIPAASRTSHATIRGYFDNVRYALLDPLTMVWGTITNALRVAAAVDNVTDAQRKAFTFSPESLTAFVRAAHLDGNNADALYQAFKPMPAADCQTLAALFNPHLDVRVDGATVLSLVRVLGNEGPLSSAEEQALATLKTSGLISAAFTGIRGQG
jgi:hypothetical protein